MKVAVSRLFTLKKHGKILWDQVRILGRESPRLYSTSHLLNMTSINAFLIIMEAF